MGTLANTVFQALMGWIRTLSVEVWNMVTSTGSTSFLGWIGEHWKGLAVVGCALGVVIDLAVYLLRWRPMWVWRSFFRRLKEGRADEDEEPEEEIEEEIPEEIPEEVNEPEPVYEKANEPLTYAPVTPEGTTARFEQAIRPRRRRRVNSLIRENDQEVYAAPDELIDQNEAYRRPVYPSSWRADEGDDD